MDEGILVDVVGEMLALDFDDIWLTCQISSKGPSEGVLREGASFSKGTLLR